MPLYEYECGACGHRFEVIQKFSDEPIEVCPKCGEHKVHKLLSSPAFQFKGSGWYITDYARKGGSGDAKSDDKGSADKKTEKADKSDKTDKPTSTSSSTPSSTGSGDKS